MHGDGLMPRHCRRQTDVRDDPVEQTAREEERQSSKSSEAVLVFNDEWEFCREAVFSENVRVQSLVREPVAMAYRFDSGYDASGAIELSAGLAFVGQDGHRSEHRKNQDESVLHW